MTARGWSLLVAILAAVSIAATTAQADDAALADALRAVVEANHAAYDSKNVDAMLKTIDSDSPAYDVSRAALEDQAPELAIQSKLVEFHYIGHDDEFAVARGKTRTTTVAKPDVDGFADNLVDAILLFHFEDGVWKLWTEQVLAVEPASE